MSEALPSIYALIPVVMKEIGAVGKDRKNEQQGYKFRGIEDIYNAAHPALISAGVFCVPQVLEWESADRVTKNGGASIRVTMRISHKFYGPDGTFVDVITCGEGIDSSDKATNKAMSAAMKYAFVELLSLPYAEIDDSDKDNPESGSKKSNAPRTTEPIKVDPPRKAAKLEPLPDPPTNEDGTIKVECIDRGMQANFAKTFREALRPEIQKSAETFRHDWLMLQHYTDLDGNPSSSTIPLTDWPGVRDRAIDYAKTL